MVVNHRQDPLVYTPYALRSVRFVLSTFQLMWGSKPERPPAGAARSSPHLAGATGGRSSLSVQSLLALSQACSLRVLPVAVSLQHLHLTDDFVRGSSMRREHAT